MPFDIDDYKYHLY